MDLLSSIGAFIGGIGLAISSFLFPVQEPENLSAALPSATAVFETSLAAPISSSATSLTLTANSVRGGGSLSGYACFTIDEGTSQAEFVCGTVSGTTVSSLTRGVSASTGTTTDTDLQFAHRRGASVKITDYPLIQIIKAQNNGEDTFPNILRYTSHPTFTATTDIVDKKYVDDTAFAGAGVIDATTLARGVSELATGAEAAATTPNGGSGPLVLPASIATSTSNGSVSASHVIVSDLNGKLDEDWLPGTLANSYTFTGGITGITDVQVYTATTTAHAGVYTWTKPTGATSVQIIAIGGGGAGGGGGKDNSGDAFGGGGGAPGGYSVATFPASLLASTETATAGNGGASGAGSPTVDVQGSNGSNGGNTSFGSWLIATGGTGGVGGGPNASGLNGTAGTPGTGAIYAISTTSPLAGSASGAANSTQSFAPTGGGAGGNGSGTTAGGAGGARSLVATLAGGTAGSGGAGGAGNTIGANSYIGGTGGGGGAGGGFAGGAGGNYGAGGGGGGGLQSGSGTAGNGGAGASGVLVVITYR